MAAQFDFASVMSSLEQMGFYDVALPFLLIFTITFAILQKIKIFGNNSKNFNAVIAIVMAFLVVRSEAVVSTMNLFLPKISLISIIVISLLLLVGLMMGKESAGFTKSLGGIGMVLIVIAVGIAFLSSSGAFGFELPSWLNFSSYDRNLFIAIGFFLVLIILAFSDSGQGNFGQKAKSFFEELGNSFGGP
jgi:hypothetical protein